MGKVLYYVYRFQAVLPDYKWDVAKVCAAWQRMTTTDVTKNRQMENTYANNSTLLTARNVILVTTISNVLYWTKWNERESAQSRRPV